MNASRSSSKNDSTTNQSELDLSFDESVLQLIDEPFQMKVNQSKLRTDFKYSGFDSTMGNTWIYPTNYPIRQYQLHISRVSLYKNTLVSWLELFEMCFFFLISSQYVYGLFNILSFHSFAFY